MSRSVSAAFLITTLLGAGAALAQPRYRLVDLGTLGGARAVAFALNERGDVVGYASTSTEDNAPWRAYLARSGTMFGLGALATDPARASSRANAVNQWGQVAGGSLRDDGAHHAVVWDRGGIRDLGVLVPGAKFSDAAAINDWGHVAGTALAVPGGSDGPYRAFVHRGGRMIALGTLGGDSAAYGINNWGQVVGFSVLSTGVARAVLWSGSQTRDLGTLGGANSQARAINDLGQIVGFAETAGGPPHAFLYERGRMVDLGTLGGPTSFALGINMRGDVVGWSSDAGGEPRPFLRAGGVMHDLTSLVSAAPAWRIYGAVAINASRVIVADCALEGESRACLLVPSPAP